MDKVTEQVDVVVGKIDGFLAQYPSSTQFGEFRKRRPPLHGGGGIVDSCDGVGLPRLFSVGFLREVTDGDRKNSSL